MVQHTKLGPYEIVEMLGAGGMGEVYRAYDSRLKRDVALKVLPQRLASDPERMERFEREAQLLASINHPNIASIYGLEESSGTLALVMELVDGPTLAERLARGGLSVSEALAVARQIAEAVEYAHERGIIHRDLKPANIKVTSDDSVKVLDFGLAKALSDDAQAGDPSTSPTLTAVATQAGIILGTAAYMSPEQARGRALDRRTDVWAFGCVLFEMLTGKVAFSGETTSDTLAAVLTKEPECEQLPVTTPTSIRRLISRCLQKQPKARLQAIGDARIEIEDCLTGRSSEGLVQSTIEDEDRRSSMKAKRLRFLEILAAFLIAVSAGSIVWWLKPSPTTNQDWAADMIAGPNVSMGPRVSPDGHTLAFQAMVDNLTQVAVSSPDTGSWTLLTRDRQHGLVNEISWAPDGSKLYYDRILGVPAGIYSVPVLGGPERLILEHAGSPQALPDGSLLLIREDSKAQWEIYHFWPNSQRLDPLPGWVTINTTPVLRIFPDGKEAVFHGMASKTDRVSHLYLMDISSGKTRRLAPYLPDRRSDESYPIATTADSSGVLVDVSAGELHQVVLVPRDGKGSTQTLATLTRPFWYLDSAKDGTLYLDQVDRPHEILRYPVSGGKPETLGSSDTYVPSGQYMDPVETSDGRFLLDTQFSGQERLLIGKPNQDFVPLLDIRDQTSSPAISLGTGEVALVLGNGSDAMVVIASSTDGRILRWLQGTKGRHITGLAVSPDSKTIYFGAEGYIWSIPVEDGSPKRLVSGENVSADPNGKDLVITSNVFSNSVLARFSLSDGNMEQIRIGGEQELAPVPTGGRAISTGGKILITTAPSDSWFYRVAILDLKTGGISPIKVNYAGDTLSGNWSQDGRVISVGLPLKSRIWRFRRTSK